MNNPGENGSNGSKTTLAICVSKDYSKSTASIVFFKAFYIADGSVSIRISLNSFGHEEIIPCFKVNNNYNY